MGKSYGVIKWAKESGSPLTIFTSRRELYGQYKDWCNERGLSYRTLPAFHQDCSTIAEGEPIENDIVELYNSGISGAQLHENSQRNFGQELPCQESGPCPYMEQREFDPADYDVLIGHYLQAHNKRYVEDRYVAFDEFPDDAYFFEPTHNEATRAVSNYLKAEDSLPFENWKDLIYRRNNDEYEEEVREWKDDLGFYSYRDTRATLKQKPGFHAHAPLLTHAGLEFNLLENEWEYAQLGSGKRAVRSPEDEWTVLIPPPLYAAQSVIALDGTPTITKWRIVLGGDYLNHEKVLETSKLKRKYLREVLNLNIIQTDAGSKPYQSGTHVNLESDGALLENIREREGGSPSVITSKKAIEQYESSKITDYIDVAEHYGNLKGSNQFADTQLGVIIGSPHPPEGEAVKRWAALEGESVSRKTNEEGRVTRGTDLDFGTLGNALFRGVVENEVLQAVMRFGRNPDDEDSGATVYVHTSRLPYWVHPDERIEVKTWSNGMRGVVEVLRASTEWPDGELTNAEIAESTDIGTRQVGELMKELAEEGYVTFRRGGRGNAYRWSNVRLEEIGEFGIVV